MASNDWKRGYACAVATAIKIEGCVGTKERELFQCAFMDVEECIAAGVDEADLSVFLEPKNRKELEGR